MRPLRCCLIPFLLALSASGLAGATESPPWERGEIDPPWAKRPAKATVVVEHDGRRSDAQNGAALYAAIKRLRPGTRLRIGPGTYSIEAKTSLDLEGSAEAPIWIEAFDPKRPPVITRSDAKQNVLNVGEKRASYLALRGLVLRGGSSLIRLYACSHVWIDRCELTRAGAEGITANVKDTDHLFITRNHIHHLLSKGSTCEGMYLGANGAKAIMSFSVIAENHVHDTGGTQGDGIEVKPGSHSNWIVGNHVHDTRYPAILVYGTRGKGTNRIERNLCYRSKDNVLQVQGEALVRNNVLIGGANAAFASTDHAGKSKHLVVVHNTFVNRKLAVKLGSWSGREGMVFANNLVVSEGRALHFPKGSEGVTLTGNLVSGSVEGTREPIARLKGKGLSVFAKLSWDGEERDARPRPGALRGGDPNFRCPLDLDGDERSKRRVTPGAVEVKKASSSKKTGKKGKKSKKSKKSKTSR